jgi:hypothetical protein
MPVYYEIPKSMGSGVEVRPQLQDAGSFMVERPSLPATTINAELAEPAESLVLRVLRFLR